MVTIPSTFASSETILKPSLSAMPAEILIEIAGWVAKEGFILDETRSELQYTTNSGELRRYRPWDCHGPIIKPKKTYNKFARYRKTSILSLSLTCARLSQACEVVLYRNPIVYDNNGRHLYEFLNNITREECKHLQRYVAHLSVIYGLGGTEWESPPAIHHTLGSGALQLPVLRSLYIVDERWGDRISPWYKLLPTLPALEDLTLKGFCKVDRGFPMLPRVKSACFYNCTPTRSTSALRGLLAKLPSLRQFGNIWTFSRIEPDAFEPVRDTLESLAWWKSSGYIDETISGPCTTYLRRLRHLQACMVRKMFADDVWTVPLWGGKALAGMESLETVEVFGPGYGLYDELDNRSQLFMALRNILATFASAKNEGWLKSLRVVNLRSFEGWRFDAAEWRMMRTEFLNDAMKEYKKLEIELLLPEMAGFP
ncbi:hypothetical protein LZ32DRAFT_644796 [Colletotrichum eremochloae]|nr:hypothetical protein LZ32DRAFT_644796 [Colletotrichum eremochloae]